MLDKCPFRVKDYCTHDEAAYFTNALDVSNPITIYDDNEVKLERRVVAFVCLGEDNCNVFQDLKNLGKAK